MDVDEVASAFVSTYYQLFDQNQREQIGSFYQAESMLSFEGDKFQGPADITKKLTGLQFQVATHVISTIDAQPSPGNGVIVFVSGTLAMDQDNPMQFSQVFNLLPLADGSSYYVLNDIFRLVLG